MKRCHAIQVTHEKECWPEENIQKQAIRSTSHDYSYCRERNNVPAEETVEVEWQRRECINGSQSGSSGVPCEVGK